MIAVFKMRADVVLPNRLRPVRAVKGDTGTRFIDVFVTVNGEPMKVNSGTPTINVKRPDGAEDKFQGTINEDGTVRLPIDKWAIDVSGEVICSCSIEKDGKKLTTTEFSIIVQE